MTHVKYQGVEYVLSRVRSGRAELVDVTTGQLKVVDEHELTNVEREVKHIGVLANIRAFSLRPKEFLDELRQRRRTLLEECRKGKAATSKRKETNGVRPRKNGSKKVSPMELLMAKFGMSGHGRQDGATTSK